jgi:DNA-binding response OmpR family regulator
MTTESDKPSGFSPKTLAVSRKLFFVDDERQIADVLSLALGEAAFDVETFYDARSALRRARDCLPDILVSDVVMPEMDGITLARSVRILNPNCKVILISGNPFWAGHDHLRDEGFDDFALLLKPFSFSHLLRLIKSQQS